MVLEKDLVDDSTASEAIKDSLATGKVSFEGTAEQKIRTESGKTEETKIQSMVELKQKVTLEKDVRMQDNVKLSLSLIHI